MLISCWIESPRGRAMEEEGGSSFLPPTHSPGSYINTCEAPSSMERENFCKVAEGVTSYHAEARQAPVIPADDL